MILQFTIYDLRIHCVVEILGFGRFWDQEDPNRELKDFAGKYSRRREIEKVPHLYPEGRSDAFEGCWPWPAFA